MDNQGADDRSSSVKAMSLVSRITTISFMVVIPAVIGYLVDGWLGSGVAFMFLGALLGMVAGAFQLVKLVRNLENKSKSEKRSS